MAAKMIVGSIAGLGVLAGGAVLAGRLGGNTVEFVEPTTPASSQQPPASADRPTPTDGSTVILDERDGPVEGTDGAFSINDRNGFQINGGKFTKRDQVKTDMLDRFDADGDGELSEAETLAAKEAFRAERDARREQWLLEKYDTNGDGVLSDEERAQEDKDRAAREEKRIDREAENLRRALAAYDADGDGVLSEEEKQTGREARSAYMTQQHEAMSTLFDADQNGQMSDAERGALHATMGDMFAQMKFVRSFDSNGDHAVTIADMPAYMDLFAAGDGRADLDFNGIVDESDLAAFQERALTPTDPRLAEAMGWFDNAPPSVDSGFGNIMVMTTGQTLIEGATLKMTLSGGQGNFVIKGGGAFLTEGDGQVVIIETIEVPDDQ